MEPEFSRTVSITRIDHGEIVQKVTANPEECHAVQARLKLAGLSRLGGEFILRRDQALLLYQVAGEASADITQTCVVSGEEFASTVTATIRALFGEGADIAIDQHYESWDDVEPVTNGEIDIGELAVQHISLNLDPYPRKPGVELGQIFTDEKPESPFAVLKGLAGET